MSTHESYMQRCIDLARLGASYTAPNPMVGAVLVHDGRILSEGYHHAFGEAHAEVDCLQNCMEQSLIPDSILYVSLEPCSYFGKTPPCVNTIIEHGIKQVVVGCGDPNPKVKGNGIRILRDHGVEVVEGVLESHCLELNPYFNHFHSHKTPFITLKWAQTKDGFMGLTTSSKSNSRNISSPETNRWVHHLRAEHQVILVGAQTILQDNPHLNTRLFPGKSPRVAVIAPHTTIPNTCNILKNQEKPVVFCLQETEQPDSVEKIVIQENNATQMVIEAALKREWQSILVEGGAQTLKSFMSTSSYHRIIQITNPSMEWNSGIKAPELPKKPTQEYFIGLDNIKEITV